MTRRTLTRKQWVKVLLWSGIALIIIGFVSMYTVNYFSVNAWRRDFQWLAWAISALINQIGMPLGATLVGGSFIVRALRSRPDFESSLREDSSTD